MVARNILRTDVLPLIKETPDVFIYILTTGHVPPEFEREFLASNVAFIGLEEQSTTRLKLFFNNLILPLIHSDIAMFKAHYGQAGKGRSLFYLGFLIVWSALFGRLNTVKRFFRRLEMFLFREDMVYESIFEKYKPDVVFSTSIMNKYDVMLLKQAKRRGITTVSMPKGWDTFEKYLFPVKPDYLMAQNEDLKQVAVKSQDVPESGITVTGFPNFDTYVEQMKKPFDRDAFLLGLGLNPGRKVIFFGSGGLYGPSDMDIGNFLYDFIKDNQLVKQCSLIIRPHFLDKNAVRFNCFAGLPNVYVDDSVKRLPDYGNVADPQKSDMELLGNFLRSADVTINPSSSLSLDAAVFDKPVICVALKEDEHGSALLNTSYYQKVVKSGGVRAADGPDALKKHVNAYLENPELDKAGREFLRSRMCYKLDGRSSVRIAAFLQSLLK